MTRIGFRASVLLLQFLKKNHKGGYYVLPGNVCEDVILTFSIAKVDVQFVDIDLATLCVCEKEVLTHIEKPNCEGLLFIYTYGTEKNFDSFFEKLKKIKPELNIIEDKCLSKPSFERSNASVYAEFTLYSTGLKKYIDLGGGGFFISHKELLLEEELDKTDLEHLAINAVDSSFYSNILESGISPKIAYKNKIEAVLIEIASHKNNVNQLYLDNIPTRNILQIEGLPSCNWRFNILVNEKETLLKSIFANNLFASSHYRPNQSGLVNAQLIHSKIVNLFNDNYIEISQAKQLSKLVKKHIATYG